MRVRATPRLRVVDAPRGTGPVRARCGVDATSGWRSRLFGVSTKSGSGSQLEQRRLPAQQVEVLRRRRAVDEAQVDVGRRLQEALGTRARVLRSLAFVAVRQQEHQRRRQAPLRAARRHELVEHHLRAVDEVAVLRFPDHEAPRLLHVVAELEADRRVLAERAVVDLERRARPAGTPAAGRAAAPSFASWNTAWRWLNVPRSTSSPVRRIGDAVGEDRRERQLLGRGPIDRCARPGSRAPPCAARGRVRACGGT